jgi:hydrogenase maturation protease
VGLGNEFRHDDAVGVEAARLLSCDDLPHVTVQWASGEGVDLLHRWEEYDHVVVVDAVRSGARPGTLHYFDAARDTIPTSFFSYSSHAFGLAESIALARALDRLPATFLIFGVEGIDFAYGQGLSPAVERGVQQVVLDIRKKLQTNSE